MVLNTPPSPAAAPERTCTDVRDACGLRPEQPLAVYCGGASPQRGLHTLVGTLALLPEVHLALVINTLDSDYVEGPAPHRGRGRRGRPAARDGLRAL